MSKAISLSAALLVVAAVSARPAFADDWHNAANYPARVTAIVFGSQTLDATHPVTFGSWSVSFGPGLSPMTANGNPTYFTFPYGDANSPPLWCANAVAGRSACDFDFIPAQGAAADRCQLSLVIGRFIQTPCPTGIQFER